MGIGKKKKRNMSLHEAHGRCPFTVCGGIKQCVKMIPFHGKPFVQHGETAAKKPAYSFDDTTYL